MIWLSALLAEGFKGWVMPNMPEPEMIHLSVVMLMLFTATYLISYVHWIPAITIVIAIWDVGKKPRVHA